ncbi:MAG: chemotaxis response regulator protein-glutamate methylesterase [Dehalococcoidia bacterium]
MGAKTRALVVDDSAVVRAVLSRQLSGDPDIEVVGLAADGRQALEMLQSLKPDVVTLDVEMPGRDGLATLKAIMEVRPTPVIMVSGLTAEGAEVTLRSLEAGAVDFVTKPVAAGVPALHKVTEELRAKVKMASGVRPRLTRPETIVPQPGARPAAGGPWRKRVAIIASSTGGPQALRTVVASLPVDFVPTIVVQHMPREFTRSLAARLDQVSAVRVEEASSGARLEPGRVLLAPGGYHTVVAEEGVRVRDGPPQQGMRPSADVTMESAAKAFGASALAVVLTGMGADGTRGAGLIKRAGGHVIAQDEATSVVYGMPKSVAESGCVDRVVAISEIASAAVEMCR